MFNKILQIYAHLPAKDGVANIISDLATVFDQYKIKNKILGISLSEESSEFIKNKWFDINTITDHLSPKTLLIFHFAMPTELSYSIPMLDYPRVLLYHNLTPPEYFKKYNPNDIYNVLITGYKEISYMAPYFAYAWGDSEYNCKQLRLAGFNRTSVAYPPINFDRYANIQKKINGNRKKNILFVGRIAPNKKQEDIIKAFYYYHRINPDSELTLVGNYAYFENYKYDLEQLSKKLKLPVNFTGSVSDNELIEHYQNADLFLCMSEHEGFCIPLIEAMYFEIPVVAFNSSVIPETIGNAGIIFNQKHFPSIGHLINEVLSDFTLQEKMKAAGKERASFFSKENSSKKIIKLIKDYSNELGI